MLAARPMDVISYLWIAFLLYMIAAARNVKRTEIRESFSSRGAYLALMIVGAIFLFSRRLALGALGVRFAPSSRGVILAGGLITILGLCFAAWARHHLGRNWSGAVTIKEDHELVKTGPYTYFRHPLYVGIGVALLGTALVEGRWKAVIGILLLYAGLWKKAHTENIFLARHFGERAAKR